MPPAKKPRPTLTIDERVAILESELAELSRLLRAHMEREEETTQAVMRSLASIEQRLSRWHGLALGGVLAVSAMWSMLLAALAWMR